MKNKSGEIVSFYFRSIVNDASTSSTQVQAKHFYLKNRSGIYPGYPKKETKKLILTEAIIDAASLLQIKNIVRKGCHTELVEVIACFGTNGLNGEILNAIKELPELEEIIFCFDQDKAGKEATKKYAKLLSTDNQQLTTSFVELPNNDINETLQLHSEEIFTKLLQERKFLFQMEKK
ncbi:toprim domain-containing protein [Chryseobacterium wanjuense]